MSTAKPITIIGGGLAGLTLGIGLRQRGVPVTVWEAGHYPRHRVCGEFISGNGQAVLERLGLRGAFEKAGAIEARTAQFIAGKNKSPVRALPPALCLSRFEMDRLLAEEFRRLGGELREGERWPTGPHNVVGQAFEPAGSRSFPASSSLFTLFRLKPGTRKSPEPAGWKACPTQEGVIRASGRRPHPTANGWRWFGLKVHARNVDLRADLEMHISRDSYVGVNRINNGEVNVCGLFRARTGDSPVESKYELLRGVSGSSLRERLADAEFDESSFCSVAGLSLKPQRAITTDEICIGDALTMIPPATGNGMSMAFESAEMAIKSLVAYSHGERSWVEAHRTIARNCDNTFARRLAWARFLQTLMFSSVARNPIGGLLLRSELFWRLMFSRTR